MGLSYLQNNWSPSPSYDERTWTTTTPPELQRKGTRTEDGQDQEVVATTRINTAAVITFDNLELIQLLGHGEASLGFSTARVKGHNDTFIAKIGFHERDLHKADTEIAMFEILNAPPTIPNIPKLSLAINRIPNPYRGQFMYLMRKLGIDRLRSSELAAAREISVITMEYFDGDDCWLETVDVLRVFLKSLLHMFEFTHSRNVMMCDLHQFNIYFDGKTVKIWDWNPVLVFKPDDSVKMDYPGNISSHAPRVEEG
jgi:hypothetical protein